MKKMIVCLVALTSITAFAGSTQVDDKVEMASTVRGGCFVNEVLVWDKVIDDFEIKYAVFNNERERLSRFFDESKEAYLESADMRKNGRCKITF